MLNTLKNVDSGLIRQCNAVKEPNSFLSFNTDTTSSHKVSDMLAGTQRFYQAYLRVYRRPCLRILSTQPCAPVISAAPKESACPALQNICACTFKESLLSFPFLEARWEASLAICVIF